MRNDPIFKRFEVVMINSWIIEKDCTLMAKMRLAPPPEEGGVDAHRQVRRVLHLREQLLVPNGRDRVALAGPNVQHLSRPSQHKPLLFTRRDHLLNVRGGYFLPLEPREPEE